MKRLLSGLRTRLFLSFTVVIGLTLFSIAAALFLFLFVRQNVLEQVAPRLALGVIDLQDSLRADIPATGPTRAQVRQIRLWIGLRTRGQELRVIVVDGGGQVSFDSSSAYANGMKVDFIRNRRYRPSRDAEIDPDVPLSYGELRNPNGTVSYFVSEQLRSNQQSILLATPAPRTNTLASIVAALGDDLLVPLAQAGLVGVVIAVLLSAVIARSIARPLQALAEAASAVGKGDLAAQVIARGPREIRTVAEAFNHMTCEVAGMQQTQRDFLANVTHDLRTPLTSIQGFSQAIVDGVAADPQAATRAATIIYDEAGRLNRMVQELLDLARLESGQFQMTWHTLQIADLLTAVAERLQPKAADKGVRLTVDVAPLPALAGDGDRLVQVFTNLLDNGIKHTAAGGSVTLEARSHPEPNGAGIVVKVRDTGDGIPAADLPHIFDRFYQVDKSRRSKDGAGLGLTISRQIIEAHGGQITVQSVEGLGTLFSVWLPTTPADSGTSKRRTVKPS